MLLGLGTRLRVRRNDDRLSSWRLVGSSAGYDILAVEHDGEICLGTCYRLGTGPDSWYCQSTFESVPYRGHRSQQDCIWELLRLYPGPSGNHQSNA